MPTIAGRLNDTMSLPGDRVSMSSRLFLMMPYMLLSLYHVILV